MNSRILTCPKVLMSDEIHELKPDNILDLHNFRPNEVKELVGEFIWSCSQSSFQQGTIIHGKGSGSLRELTHSILVKSPNVKSFQLGDAQNPGNWGMTTFVLSDQDT